MVKVLLTAATTTEAGGALAPDILLPQENASGNLFRTGHFEDLDILIHGPGTPSTIFQLTTYCNKRKPDLIIQVGIAGSFTSSIPIGTVCAVADDRFADLGAEDDTQFIDLFEMGLAGNYYKAPLLTCDPSTLMLAGEIPHVHSITVNTTTGSLQTTENRKIQFQADIESMEGAAAMYVAEQFGIPLLQIRAISNIVEKRNKAAWNIPLAVQELNPCVRKILNKLFI